ncbi:transposase [Candidatus Pacearchaeota archaeon]|nr:transposase [Candidatus Pacearchaeota archaeon]
MAKIYRGEKIVVESDGKYVKKYKLSDEIAKREKREASFKTEKPEVVQTCLSTHKSTNHRLVHLALTNEKRMFWILLSELAEIFDEGETESSGGRPKAKLSDLIFSLGLKLYTNTSGRVLNSDLKLFENLGFIFKSPGVNTLNDFLNCEGTKDLLLRILHITAIPLKFIDSDMIAMDSSGFGSYQYERWMRVRFKKGVDGKELHNLKRNYLKAHIAVGTVTHAVYSCVITPGNYSDDKQVPELLGQLFYNSEPRMISGDKAYSSYRTLQIIEKLGAIPIIPFKKNANPQEKSPDIWKIAFDYFKNHKEEFYYQYRQRPQVEAAFSINKRKFGEFLRCKNFVSQTNELLMKFICNNICRLIAEIFERKINVDFKECMEEYINRKAELKEKLASTRKTKKT